MWDRLENSDALQLFWLIPVIAGLGWYLTKVQSQNIRKVLGSRLAPYLLANLSPTRRKLKLILGNVLNDLIQRSDTSSTRNHEEIAIFAFPSFFTILSVNYSRVDILICPCF